MIAAVAALVTTTGCGGEDSPAVSEESGMEDAGSMDTGTGDTWASFGMGFMDTYCVDCHPNNPLSERDYTSYEAVAADGDRIRCGVSPGELEGCGDGFPVPSQFPIGNGPMPSDPERERLVAWIEAGMPE